MKMLDIIDEKLIKMQEIAEQAKNEKHTAEEFKILNAELSSIPLHFQENRF